VAAIKSVISRTELISVAAWAIVLGIITLKCW
jgi:hypothetical protein